MKPSSWAALSRRPQSRRESRYARRWLRRSDREDGCHDRHSEPDGMAQPLRRLCLGESGSRISNSATRRDLGVQAVGDALECRVATSLEVPLKRVADGLYSQI